MEGLQRRDEPTDFTGKHALGPTLLKRHTEADGKCLQRQDGPTDFTGKQALGVRGHQPRHA